jgi:hypothetical protein
MEAATGWREAADRAWPPARADALLAVPEVIAELWPDGGVRRGSTIGLGPARGEAGPGEVALALELAATVSGRSRWVAAVGLGDLGLVAAAEAGVDLCRLVLVPSPGEQWLAVVAALVDGFDLLLVRPPARVRVGEARRLMARVRERGAVLAVLGAGWPETVDVRLGVEVEAWEGLGRGWGHLAARRVDLVVSGRRVGGRQRRRRVWLGVPAGGTTEVAAAPLGGRGVDGGGMGRAGWTEAG